MQMVYSACEPSQQQQQAVNAADDSPEGRKAQPDERFDSIVLSTRDWQARWQYEPDIWIEPEGNALFRNNIGLLNGAGKSLKVFVPLCGNAVEMKWLYEMGHTVVGVDCFEGALLRFFQEHGIQYVSNKLSDSISVFCSSDGKLRLYACDLYEFSRTNEKLFDAIWDRGSLVAINLKDRERYAELLMSLMAPQCQYLLCVEEYDSTTYFGTPHNVTLKDICGLYKDLGCTIKLIESKAVTDERYPGWGLHSVEEKLYLISSA